MEKREKEQEQEAEEEGARTIRDGIGMGRRRSKERG